MKRLARGIVPIALISLGAWTHADARGADRRPLPKFERVVIDDAFPDGYQVEVADVNGDGKPDVVGVGGGTCAWYVNPSWTKRVVASGSQTPGIISSATADLDGDGVAEIAIAYEFAMDKPTRGKLVLASQGVGPDDAWSLTPIAEIGSIHRLRWGDFDGDKRPDLAVASIFGAAAKGPKFDQDPAKVVVLRPGADPRRGGWAAETVGARPVLHAINVLDFDGDGRSDILAANALGVEWWGRKAGEDDWTGRTIAAGSGSGSGCSEVHVGRLADGSRFLATIDPWHGNELAIRAAVGASEFGPRRVIDATLADGHALWVADVDGDGDDEVFAGHRGRDARVSAYDFDGKDWVRTVLDEQVTAQDLRGGDLDGDGTPDVVAIGGRSHNVVWYRPVAAPKKAD